MMDLTTADLAFQDVNEGHLTVRRAYGPMNDGEGDGDGRQTELDKLADAWLKGDQEPATAFAKAHEAKVRARAALAGATPEERVEAMHAAHESVLAISLAVGWSRGKVTRFLDGGRPRVAIDNHRAIAMRAAGKKLAEIAAEIGCSYARAGQITGVSKKQEPIDAKRDRILSLRRAGWTFRAIQKELHVRTSNVRKVIEEAEAAAQGGIKTSEEVQQCA